jgi:membrane-bound lytic murein transglycosylase B
MDTLTTLAFDYPPRAAFFREELEHFLVMAHVTGVDALGIKGSYAGAMGMPQFMPGSYQRFALDYDGDGRADLNNPADAIGSVANFLCRHGWSRGGAVAVPIHIDGERPGPWLDAGLKPSLRLADMMEMGSVPAPLPAPSDALVALVELGSGSSEYRLGFDNFYVLTRYNRSTLYAMAVLELAQALKGPQEADPQPAAGSANSKD